MKEKEHQQLLNDAVDPFSKYYINEEPNVFYKAYAWQTAIGLQDVDKLSPSDYLVHTAKENIEGNITIEKAKQLIDDYYIENIKHLPGRTEEADKVAVRIAEILSEDSFVFSPTQYISIHKRLFTGIYSHAGKFRDYNISKKEWVLNGASVMYGGALELRDTLEYDFQIERDFSYADLDMNEIIKHLALFVSRLWQIHIFGEGNTRTTAVFFIKYLRSLGFKATNEIFSKNAWYFRNALVRANYNDLAKGIRSDIKYLELFLRNLLLDENNELRNRYLHVDCVKTAHSDEKQHMKQHIEAENSTLNIFTNTLLRNKTKKNIECLYLSFGKEKIFGRTDVMNVLSITESPASALLKKMRELGLIESIIGVGKGKYRFAVSITNK